MKTSINKKRYLSVIASYIIDEFKKIATSYSILLVMIGGVFIYGLLYNYMYQPNLIRHAPIALVDASHTPLSREYARLLSASPQVEIYETVADFQAAKELLKKQDVIGIVYIPHDFEKKVGRGEQSVFAAMGNTSAFLNFASVQEATADAMAALDARHISDMVVFLSLESLYAISQSHPINVDMNILYNYTEGYGSYLIPAVLIIIIFQTLMMVIGMIVGGERYDKTILRYAENGLGFKNLSAIVLGKSFTYAAIYIVFGYFLIGLLPQIFSIPNIGNTVDIIALLIPFFLASCFFGFTCSIFYTDSESPILMIAFFSVGYVFLSGISYPLELIPWYWQILHSIIPAPPAVMAYIRLNSMGATLSDVKVEYLTLWLQCIVYFLLACLAFRYNIKKAELQFSK